jgi:hypothetical protein
MLMGIDNAAAKMLLLLRNEEGADFSKTIILGRQHNYIGPILRRAILKNFEVSQKSMPLAEDYADEFLETLGIVSPAILDVSNYEGATILHDLNTPIPIELRCQYSTVIDIGTSEHVYNVTQALQNLKDLCAINGHVVIISPANNWLGHGFYQFSPELFFRTFDTQSGFEIRKLFLIKLKRSGDTWYELSDPKSLGRRGTITTKNRCHIALMAIKVSSDISQDLPQQSDYETAWESPHTSKLGALYLGMPWILRRLVEMTLLPIRNRVKSRMRPIHFEWSDGRFGVKTK